MRTLFKKGAALGPSLAFLAASTNLVLELGVILWLLLGWRFMVAEWLGGLVMIAVMIPVSRMLVHQRLIDAARNHDETHRGHDHGAMPCRATAGTSGYTILRRCRLSHRPSPWTGACYGRTLPSVS